MPDTHAFALFLTAAIALAVTPGPGIFYVLTRSIKGGRTEGIVSALGTGVGGFFHVVAAALGLSAIVMTSAVAFNLVKYIGAIYLIYLGIRTILQREEHLDIENPSQSAKKSNSREAFRQGITTEILNPKTALFFLAFLPQFINPEGSVVLPFIVLGSISVFLNTSADFVVAFLAGLISKQLQRSRRLRRAQQTFSGSGLIALGTYVAVSGDSN